MDYIKRVKEACEKASRITKYKLSLHFDNVYDDRVIITYSYLNKDNNKRTFKWGSMIFTDWQIEQYLVNKTLNDFYEYFEKRIKKRDD